MSINRNHICWQTSVISTDYTYLTHTTESLACFKVSSVSQRISRAFISFECQTDKYGPVNRSRCRCSCICTLSQLLISSGKKRENGNICLVRFNQCHAISVNTNLFQIFSRSLYRDVKHGKQEKHVHAFIDGIGEGNTSQISWLF